ncbi:MAG TPA: phosphate acyltransferase, partial [Porticoccaceae bacterium]
YVSGSRLFMQPIIELAQRHPARIVYAEGENDDVLLAMQAVVDEGVAKPLLIGRPAVIERKIDKMGLRVRNGQDIEIIDVLKADQDDRYWQFYHEQVGRSGISVEAARNTVHANGTVLAAIMVALGEADGMICGKVGRFDEHLKDIAPIIGHSRGNAPMSSVCALLLEDGPLFIADPFVNVDPTEEEIVAIARDAIDFVKNRFDIEPKVALLSHSNFGTYEDASAIKMKNAAARLRAAMPDIELEGEMHALSAFNENLRNTIFKNSRLKGRANLLVMPNMDAASIALGLIRSLTNARLVGPFLYGLNKPAHILIPSVSGRGILNTTALTVVDVLHRQAG